MPTTTCKHTWLSMKEAILRVSSYTGTARQTGQHRHKGPSAVIPTHGWCLVRTGNE